MGSQVQTVTLVFKLFPQCAALCYLGCKRPLVLMASAQLLDSVIGLAALRLTTRAVFTMAGPALLLLLLLSFLTFDMLHRPLGPTVQQHRHLTRGQSQGAGEGPGQQAAPLLPTGHPSLQNILLLLLLGLGLFLGTHSMLLALLGLAFCLHPWA
ncbi:uncharacterized protein C20orf141 homolog [Octodon degus]|uniref:Uncharacterized protein C20orf141 homolog n=1 Tax=Octodon degus TaxID=10160 RepID=A0A6P3F8N2_OCTDE|nr:uncharacterized protein C20orf141 homolog [Octodon degus]